VHPHVCALPCYAFPTPSCDIVAQLQVVSAALAAPVVPRDVPSPPAELLSAGAQPTTLAPPLPLHRHSPPPPPPPQAAAPPSTTGLTAIITTPSYATDAASSAADVPPVAPPPLPSPGQRTSSPHGLPAATEPALPGLDASSTPKVPPSLPSPPPSRPPPATPMAPQAAQPPSPASDGTPHASRPAAGSGMPCLVLTPPPESSPEARALLLRSSAATSHSSDPVSPPPTPRGDTATSARCSATSAATSASRAPPDTSTLSPDASPVGDQDEVALQPACTPSPPTSPLARDPAIPPALNNAAAAPTAATPPPQPAAAAGSGAGTGVRQPQSMSPASSLTSTVASYATAASSPPPPPHPDDATPAALAPRVLPTPPHSPSPEATQQPLPPVPTPPLTPPSPHAAEDPTEARGSAQGRSPPSSPPTSLRLPALGATAPPLSQQPTCRSRVVPAVTEIAAGLNEPAHPLPAGPPPLTPGNARAAIGAASTGVYGLQTADPASKPTTPDLSHPVPVVASEASLTGPRIASAGKSPLQGERTGVLAGPPTSTIAERLERLRATVVQAYPELSAQFPPPPDASTSRAVPESPPPLAAPVPGLNAKAPAYAGAAETAQR